MVEERDSDRIAALPEKLESESSAGNNQPVAELSPEHVGSRISQVAQQTRAQEQIRGGTGQISDIITGRNSKEQRRNLRQMVQQLGKGSEIPTVFREIFRANRQRAHSAGLISVKDEVAFLRAYEKSPARGNSQPAGTRSLLHDNFNTLSNKEQSAIVERAVTGIAEAEILRSRGRTNGSGASLYLPGSLSAVARAAPEAALRTTSLINAVRGQWGLSLETAIILKHQIGQGGLASLVKSGELDQVLGFHDNGQVSSAVPDFARHGDMSSPQGVPSQHSTSSSTPLQFLRETFSKPVSHYNFQPADEKRATVLRIAEKQRIEILTPSPGREGTPLDRASAFRIEEIFGVSVVWYRGLPKVLGFSDPSARDLIFLNAEPHERLRDIPLSWTSAHEIIHAAQNAPESGADQLSDQIDLLLTADERNAIHRKLEADYDKSQFPIEIPAFLAGDAVSGQSFFGLDDLSQSEAIRALVEDYFSTLHGLRPQTLKDAPDNDLATVSGPHGKRHFTRSTFKAAILDLIGKDQLRTVQPNASYEDKLKLLDDFSHGVLREGPTPESPDRISPDGESPDWDYSTPDIGQPDGIQVIEQRLANDLLIDTQVRFLGETIQSAEDLAVKAMAIRNPMFETFYIFALKPDPNSDPAEQRFIVADVMALSNRIPCSSHSFMPPGDWTEGARQHAAFLKASGAEDYLFLHNHPSGDPKPSGADRRMTMELVKAMTDRDEAYRFHGHIVINHKKFERIDDQGLVHPGIIPDGKLQGTPLEFDQFAWPRNTTSIGVNISEGGSIPKLAQHLEEKKADYWTSDPNDPSFTTAAKTKFEGEMPDFDFSAAWKKEMERRKSEKP